MHSLTLALLALANIAHSHTTKIHGVVVYSRHGDRETKTVKGYQMTPLGAQQVYDSGQFYRARYIDDDAQYKIQGISSDVYKPNQLWVSAPDQSVLLQTATNFVQGLYPPLSQVNETLEAQDLANGTKVSSPIGGYQFVQIHSEDEKDPDTIWLKGSDSCPAWNSASSTYRNSTEYLSLVQSTQSFYSQFNSILSAHLPPNKISYANAYDVFDIINVASIHNKTDIVTPEQLDQLRYYANEWESNMNYNASDSGRAIGGATLAGAFLKQLNESIASQGKLKFSLMTGSYNTFLAFFGLSGLKNLNNDFNGLPDYASSMVFELYSDTDGTTFPAEQDLRVRFLFRNGTDSSDELVAYPLFGTNSMALSYTDFRAHMNEFAINNATQWCSTCQQTQGFCSQPSIAGSSKTDDFTASSSNGGRTGGISTAVAGVIGAVVALAVVGLFGLVLFLLRRRKNKNGVAAGAPVTRKYSKEASSFETRSV